jgi:anti-sigma regulatory factor (Ser/Thr protein kinase)
VIVSELVSNSVQHTGTDIHLALFGFPGPLRLEVSDQSTRPLRRHNRSTLAEGGRGLLLVDELASHYGVVGRPEGKTVWAELSPLD